MIAGMPAWAFYTTLTSVAVSCVFLFLSFVEPYKSVLKYSYRKYYHKKGDYINAWIFKKNGFLKKVFTEVQQDGSIQFNNHTYTVNPKSQVSENGVPTQIYKEGESTPYDVYDDEGVDQLNTNELERIMTSTKMPGFLELLKKYWPIAIAMVLISAGLAVLSIYFNYQIYDVVVQGATAASEISSNP